MTLGQSQHFYTHMSVVLSCALIGLGLSAGLPLPYLFCVSTFSLFSLLRGWRSPPLTAGPGAVDLVLIILLYFLCPTILDFIGISVTTLILHRLISLKSASDHQQVYLLSFAAVTLAAHLDFDLSYGLILVAYMICVTTSLTLNHLRRELEKNIAITRKTAPQEREEGVHLKGGYALYRLLESKRLISSGFLFGVGVIATLLCVSALILFFLMPRVGGQWFQSYTRTQNQSGFSSEVDLGEIGDIQLDERVAFRVEVQPLDKNVPIFLGSEIPAPDHSKIEVDPLPLHKRYWIGTRLNTYRRGRWRDTSPVPKSLGHRTLYWLTHSLNTNSKNRSRFWRQEYFMEARGHDTLFHLRDVVATSLPLTRDLRAMKVSANRDLKYEWNGEFRYLSLSVDQPDSSPPLYHGPLEDYLRLVNENDALYSRWLNVPPSIRAELLNWVTPIVEGAQTVQEVVYRIQRHLQTEYQYSLKSSALFEPSIDSSPDPILKFLLTVRKGHCEYFSTALALTLRVLGIPTRNVTGYHGGQWSAYGGYYIVSQKDAHSWVEVWMGGDPKYPKAWRDIDPTPAGDESAALMSWFRQRVDHLRFAWYRYVVGFEAKDQAVAANKIGREVKRSLAKIKESWRVGALRKKLSTLLLFLIAAFAISLISSRRRRRLKRGLSSLWSLLSSRIYSIYKAFRQIIVQRSHESGERFVKSSKSKTQAESSALYRGLLSLYEEAGFQISPSWTSEEILDQLEAQGAPELERLSQMTRLYQEARFSISAALDQGELSPTLNQIREALPFIKSALDEQPSREPSSTLIDS